MEVLEGDDEAKKQRLKELIGVKPGESRESRMNLLIQEIESIKEQLRKGKFTQEEVIDRICELYRIEDYGSKINYSLAVKKYQPEKKARIVSDILSTAMYIVEEDAINAEQLEEISQTVKAKSYISDEMWSMAESAFRGAVAGVNAAVAGSYYAGVEGSESSSDVWDMTEGGGIINGREYSQHAMERMAPDTPSVRAELSRRAEALAESKGLQVGTPEYYQFCQKYVDPRNIPPSVIEDAIRNTNAVPGHIAGTFIHQTADVTVIVNETGKVITVIPE